MHMCKISPIIETMHYIKVFETECGPWMLNKVSQNPGGLTVNSAFISSVLVSDDDSDADFCNEKQTSKMFCRIL